MKFRDDQTQNLVCRWTKLLYNNRMTSTLSRFISPSTVQPKDRQSCTFYWNLYNSSILLLLRPTTAALWTFWLCWLPKLLCVTPCKYLSELCLYLVNPLRRSIAKSPISCGISWIRIAKVVIIPSLIEVRKLKNDYVQCCNEIYEKQNQLLHVEFDIYKHLDNSV